MLGWTGPWNQTDGQLRNDNSRGDIRSTVAKSFQEVVFPDLDEHVRTRLGEDGPRIKLPASLCAARSGSRSPLSTYPGTHVPWC